MKLAIVCDDLIQFGGAEKVVKLVSEIFPDAPVYTSVASKRWLEKYKKSGVDVYTSFLQKFPFAVKLNRVYSVFLLHILAFESFDFSEFDVVISLSSRYSHFIVTKPSTLHICYCHSPGRMFWESADYFENESFGGSYILKNLAAFFLQLPLSLIRIMDYCAAQRVDHFISNSVVTKNRINKYYGRESVLINPFADIKKSDAALAEQSTSTPYYLVITRLVAWKHVDIAIQACEELGLKLIIVGEGSDTERLKNISGKNTTFLGHVSEHEKSRLIENCLALINTQSEDFGIVPVEAMSLGKPVIAYRSGGALETVIAGETGEFFDKQTSSSLMQVLKNFEPEKYNSLKCQRHASKFSSKVFTEKFVTFVNSVYLKDLT